MNMKSLSLNTAKSERFLIKNMNLIETEKHNEIILSRDGHLVNSSLLLTVTNILSGVYSTLNTGNNINNLRAHPCA